MATKYLQANLEIAVLVDGIAFLALAFVILSQFKGMKKSEFKLPQILGLFALFAFLHGFSEIAVLFLVSRSLSVSAGFLFASATLLVAVSFAALFLFAYQLIKISRPSTLRPWLSYVLFLPFAVLFFALPFAMGATHVENWDLSVRYFICLPAGILIAVGLFLYMGTENEIENKKYLILAAVALLSYCAFDGMVAPRAEIFPARVINQSSFIEWFGIPVHYFRAIFAVGVVWSIWNVVEGLNLEQKKRHQYYEVKLTGTAALLARSVENTSRMAAIIQSSTDGIIAINLSGEVLNWNEGAARMCGYSAEEVRGRSFFSIVPQNKRPDLTLILKAVVAGGSFDNYETECLKKSGEIIDMSLSLSAIKDPQGVPIGISMIAREITKHKQYERQTEALAKLSSENPFPVLRIAGNGTVLYSNAASLSLLSKWGYEAGQIVPERWRQLVSETLASESITKDIEVTRDDRTISFTAVPVPEAGYVNLYGLDVTQKKISQKLNDALNDINAQIHSTLDFDLIMQRVVALAGKSIGSQSAAVLFNKGNRWVISYLYGLPEGVVGSSLSDMEISEIGVHMKLREPVVINDVYVDKRISRDLVDRFSLRSILTVPLIARDQVVGFMTFSYHTAPANFSDASIDFARKLGASLSLAIENAQLYATERSISQKLQESLLVVPDQVEGIDFGHLYRSATPEAARAGGDFYDLFELEHERIGLIIGDVSGKGLEAASLTALVKNTIKAYAYQEESPAKIIELTNNVVEKTSPPTSFVSVFFGIYSKETGDIYYCNAGHPPPLLQKPDTTFPLEVTCPIIGYFTQPTYIDHHETLEQGDRLILYTDGVTDVRTEAGIFGPERFFKLVSRLQTVRVHEIPNEILKALLDYGGGYLPDDIAIVAVSVEELA